MISDSEDKVVPGPRGADQGAPLFPETSAQELPEHLRRALDRAGWKDLAPVQALSIPTILAGQDLMVQARTGSGKTGAFILPILHKIDPGRAQCQALVLTPTRELARQVAGEAETLFGDTGARVIAVYGGVAYGPQEEAFRRGAHLVVGTPGRILDHLLKRNLSLEGLRMLVFDEADRMLSIGFYPDMKEVQRYLPGRKVDSFMFSATFPPQVLRLAEEFLTEPKFLSLSGKTVHVAESEHVFYEVPAMGKERCLMRVIETEEPVSAIIFCNTKAHVHFVAEVLKQFGYDADELSADLSQPQRDKVLARVREGKLRFLVATDVAARGIDIPDLSHVILYEPPEDTEGYIHRAGRTGRAGASGTVISLADVIQKLDLKRIAARYAIDLQERPLPDDSQVQEVVSQRLIALLEARLRKRTPLERERMRRYLGLVERLAAEGAGTEIMAMLLDEAYQQSRHQAPSLPSGGPPPEAESPRRPRPRKGRRY